MSVKVKVGLQKAGPPMVRPRLILEGAHSRAPASEFIISAPISGSVCKTPSLVSPSSAGDIGGQMGLFIGASILTILELFDYIYEVRFGVNLGG